MSCHPSNVLHTILPLSTVLARRTFTGHRHNYIKPPSMGSINYVHVSSILFGKFESCVIISYILFMVFFVLGSCHIKSPRPICYPSHFFTPNSYNCKKILTASTIQFQGYLQVLGFVLVNNQLSTLCMCSAFFLGHTNHPQIMWGHFT